MKVAFLVAQTSKPSVRVRIGQYLPRFRSVGLSCRQVSWEVRSQAGLAVYAARVLWLAAWADVVVLQKPRLPGWLLRTVAWVNPHLVVDFDDALWASRRAVDSRVFGERLSLSLGLARVVVAGSRYLAEQVGDGPGGRDVRVIPSVVDAGSYSPKNHEAHQSVVIGWIGTAANLRDFGPEVLEALRRVISTGGARLVLITDPAAPRLDVPCEVRAWKLEEEADALASLDIGLMPLADIERARGRCSYKAVQYMAAGLPVVASPIGSAPEVVAVGETGLLASTAEEWATALFSLVRDAEQRARLGEGGRRRVVESFSLDATTPLWLQALETARGDRR